MIQSDRSECANKYRGATGGSTELQQWGHSQSKELSNAWTISDVGYVESECASNGSLVRLSVHVVRNITCSWILSRCIERSLTQSYSSCTSRNWSDWQLCLNHDTFSLNCSYKYGVFPKSYLMILAWSILICGDLIACDNSHTDVGCRCRRSWHSGNSILVSEGVNSNRTRWKLPGKVLRWSKAPTDGKNQAPTDMSLSPSRKLSISVVNMLFVFVVVLYDKRAVCFQGEYRDT